MTMTSNGANTSVVIVASIDSITEAATTLNTAVPTTSTVHEIASSTCSTSSRKRVIISPGDSCTACAPGSS